MGACVRSSGKSKFSAAPPSGPEAAGSCWRRGLLGIDVVAARVGEFGAGHAVGVVPAEGRGGRIVRIGQDLPRPSFGFSTGCANTL